MLGPYHKAQLYAACGDGVQRQMGEIDRPVTGTAEHRAAGPFDAFAE